MKIETGWKTQQLDKVCAGTLIYFVDDFFIVTDKKSDDKLEVNCVNVKTGELYRMPLSCMVDTINNAVLKIGR